MLDLEPGTYTLVLAFDERDENMDVLVNTALLDHLRLTRLWDNDANPVCP